MSKRASLGCILRLPITLYVRKWLLVPLPSVQPSLPMLEAVRREDADGEEEEDTVIETAREDMHTADHGLFMPTAFERISLSDVGCNPPIPFPSPLS